LQLAQKKKQTTKNAKERENGFFEKEKWIPAFAGMTSKEKEFV